MRSLPYSDNTLSQNTTKHLRLAVISGIMVFESVYPIKSTISRHIKNIFSEGELNRNSVVANFATTATDGKTYQVDYYNLSFM